MRSSLLLLTVASVFGLVACKDAPPPPPPDAPPNIVTFAVDKARVDPGEPVKFTYEVEGANTLELVDDTGAFVQLSGTETSGEASITPLRSHFYVLRAEGRGGRDSAFVQVSVGEPLKEVFLVAVPPEVKGGESAQLLWGAFRNQSVTLTGSDGSSFNISGDSGAETVTPKRNTTYTLTADPGTGAPSVSASVEVRVAPVIVELAVNPGAAQTGQTITVSWKTVGGRQVTLSEATFGALYSTQPSELDKVDQGSFDFIVPATLPNGQPLIEGLPLKFKLRVTGSTPDVEISGDVAAFVGTAPVVSSFEVPKYVTEGGQFAATWKTNGATTVELRLAGQTIFRTLPTETLRAARGSLTLPAPSQNATYELIASNAVGVSASASRTLTPVKLPAIKTFDAPSSVPTPGGAANFQWTTDNASALVLRTLEGHTLHSTSNASAMTSGSREVGLGNDVTVQLAAYNLAGDVVVSTPKTVLVPPGNYFATDAGTSLPGIPLDVSFTLSSLLLTELTGVPVMDPEVSSGAALAALSANASTLTLGDGNASAEVNPGQGFTFPFFGQHASRVFASVDGVVSLQRGFAGGNNGALTATGSELVALAPFWDDLSLGANGQVRWELVGESFPRTLVIEWSAVEKAGVAGSSLTFQAQLDESGEFRFVYGTLTGAVVADATVGAKSVVHGWAAQLPPNTTAIATGNALSWFVPATTSGMFTAAFPGPGHFPIWGINSMGRWSYVEGTLRVFPPNSVIVSEAMSTPNSSAAAGQWLELLNLSPVAVDVGGLKLRSSGSAGEFVLPSVMIDPGKALVVGESTAAADNDGTPVSVAYTDVPLTPFGNNSITLSADNGVVNTFAFDGGDFGHAAQAQQPFALNAIADGGVSCPATKTYNVTTSAYGSPGEYNPPCLGYSVTRIPSGFKDISRSGAPLFSDISNDDQVVSVPLPVPVKYFGNNYSTAWIHVNGYVQFTSASASNVTNATVPNATRANAQGMIAPFWDDLYFNADGNVFVQRFNAGPGIARGHYVVQWHDMRATSTGTDRIFAQAVVFDDGVIEIHYGPLINGSSSNYAYGYTATAWIERPGKAEALVLNRNSERLLRPFTSFRFTPAP